VASIYGVCLSLCCFMRVCQCDCWMFAVVFRGLFCRVSFCLWVLCVTPHCFDVPFTLSPSQYRNTPHHNTPLNPFPHLPRLASSVRKWRTPPRPCPTRFVPLMSNRGDPFPTLLSFRPGFRSRSSRTPVVVFFLPGF